MTTIIELGCPPPFACRAVLLSPRDTELPGLVAVDDRVIGRFVEPLELLSIARELGGLRAFAASAAALEMLQDPSEPTNSAWRWLRDELQLHDIDHPFVAARGAGLLRLEPETELLEPPVLALASTDITTTHHRGETTYRFVTDEVKLQRIHFDHEAGEWWLRAPDRRWDRSKYPLLLNGQAPDLPARLVTGDVIRAETASHEVIAII